MSNQPNDIPINEHLKTIFNNDQYRQISDLTEKEKETALPPPASTSPKHTKPLPGFKKPRWTRSGIHIPPKPAIQPEAPGITCTNSTADKNFQQNIARVLGPEHVGKYHNCEDLVKKAIEDLHTVHGGDDCLERNWTAEEFETAARLTQWGVDADGLGAIIGYPETGLSKEEKKKFIEIMDDEERILGGAE
ncbi:hypothetical protein FBEOM_7459 [Fusarium beomiforme]|uniref:Uncharacterized protein n=1 Tax=Fusarium beomiforme TaxID=44412 RepID=A0A9P5AH54_9HYPO|nr:hypothetical protein FBEOM_7459 [Fusarium beomiforme]